MNACGTTQSTVDCPSGFVGGVGVGFGGGKWTLWGARFLPAGTPQRKRLMDEIMRCPLLLVCLMVSTGCVLHCRFSDFVQLDLHVGVMVSGCSQLVHQLKYASCPASSQVCCARVFCTSWLLCAQTPLTTRHSPGRHFHTSSGECAHMQLQVYCAPSKSGLGTAGLLQYASELV